MTDNPDRQGGAEDGTARHGGRLCLVTGATGYVGGRLVPLLLEAGMAVRCMTRSAARLRDQPWIDDVEVVEADSADPASSAAALAGVDVAYYLIHSMSGGPRFEQNDRTAAGVFAEQARRAGVGRLVYLGGLAPTDGRVLSPHMRSRAEVARILQDSGVPTVVLRAAVIIGSGSASFEMLRYLTERLPVMVTPRWVDSRVQPIAVRDVLRYLVGAAGLAPEVSGAFDIGGPEVLTYRQMMLRYAAVAGLGERRVLRVPVLTPRLSSGWVGLVTPVPGSLARPLVESLHHDAVCRDHAVARHIPDPPGGLVGFDKAVALALRRVREAVVATSWSSGSLPGAPSDPLPTDPSWAGGSLYTDVRRRETPAEPGSVWSAIEAIGGATGWYSLPLAWRARGVIDRAVGGVGLRRGRRDPRRLRMGDAVDFWRVEEIIPGRLLRLRAEMRLPGLAWLEMRVDATADGSCYRQRALFHPHGLAGQVYWWALKPFHGLVFGPMARNLVRHALAHDEEQDSVDGTVWFRRDLRLHDHPALHAAAARHERVVPAFFLDDRLLHGRHASGARTRFLLESLADLDDGLRRAGTGLTLRHGSPEKLLPALVRELDVEKIHFTRDLTPFARSRGQGVAEALRKLDVELVAHPGVAVVEDAAGLRTKAGRPYSMFTPFFRSWLDAARREPLPALERLPPAPGTRSDPLPTLAQLGLETEVGHPRRGGEHAGLDRMAWFLDGPVRGYDTGHDRLDLDGTSQLGAYLHFGCVSPRLLEASLPRGRGAEDYRRQLCWRDFYHHVHYHHPENATLEHQERYRGSIAWEDDESLFEAWTAGLTGFPLVDAAMRQLRREGWMHNRARLVVGCFLTKHLGIDWRRGEAYFMRMLLDGDQANNNGNWQWIASVGVDTQPVFRRIYNPTLHQKRYDPDGGYVRAYVPELAKVPDRHLAEPWRMSEEAQREAGCVIGTDYPPPIVDLRTSRAEALARYGEARDSA